VSDSPDQHPRISADERDMIVTTIGVNKSQTVRSLSFKCSPTVWAIVTVFTFLLHSVYRCTCISYFLFVIIINVGKL